MMDRGRKAGTRALAGALITAACFVTAMLVNTTAIASCDPALDPAAHTTPVGDAICGSPSPSPSPSQTSPAPSPSPTPTQSQPAQQGAPPTFVPPPFPPGYVFPTGFPTNFAQFPNGFNKNLPFGQQTQPGQTDPYPAGSNFYMGSTQAGLKMKPGGAGFFGLRAILFLIGAAVGAFTLYEARVRRWMVGI